jgi:hypothetical protein
VTTPLGLELWDVGSFFYVCVKYERRVVTLNIFEGEKSTVISLSEEWSPDACFSEPTFLMTFTKSELDHVLNNFNPAFSLTAFSSSICFYCDRYINTATAVLSLLG